MGVGGVPNSFTREAALLRGHHQSINDDQLRTLAYIPLSSKASLIGLKVSAFSLTHSVAETLLSAGFLLDRKGLNKV